MRKSVLITSGLALIGAVAWWYMIERREPPVVSVVAASKQDLSASFTADGLVQGKRYEIQSLGVKRIRDITVQEGDRVRAGQIVVLLDDEVAAGAVREAEGAVRVAESQVRSAEQAVRLATRQYEASLAGASAELKAARSQLKLLQAGNRGEAIEQGKHRVTQAEAASREATEADTRAQKLYDAGVISLAERQRAAARSISAAEELEIARHALNLAEEGARPEELEGAQAAIEAAMARLNVAKSGKEDILLKESQVRTMRAQLAQAGSVLGQARSAAKEGKLTSPSDGLVAKVEAEAGEMATPGRTLLYIVNPANLYIEAEVGDEDSAKIKVGQSVRVNLPSAPGRYVTGRVTKLSPESESKPELSLRTRIIRARIDVGEKTALRPGMEVDIEGERVLVKGALSVPIDAVFFTSNRNAVYVFRADIVSLRTVTVGYSTSGHIEVLKGLEVGDLVVTAGRENLQDGMRVKRAEKE